METLFSVSILLATLRISTPLILAALGGVFSERAGVVNIALEGMMLIGAFTAAVVSYYTHNPWLGVLGAVLAGALFAWLHAIASIKFRADQVVSGTAINILAGGLTIFLLRILFNVEGTTPQVSKLSPWSLTDLVSFNPIVYLALLAVPLSWVILYKTTFGLRLRAVGEHPQAADTVGINVYKMRYIAVLLSGVLAGLAGAHLSIGEGSVFVRYMTGGRGFIALAAMIFGKWHPVGALGASLLFGLAEAIQINLMGIQLLGITVPPEFINMIPYVVTMLVLAGFVGRSTPPAADGIPYEKGHR